MFHKNYDVVICGGGVAGAAAALAAARRGMKTALIEKTVFMGGLATSGLIYVYLPLCDGNGTQAVFGIAEELLLESIKYGPGEIPDWRRGKNAVSRERYCVTFSPASFILSLDRLLSEAGVDIWFDTLICAAKTEDSRVTGIEVENKSGRGLIEGKCFVDATGDADIAHFAGHQCKTEDNMLCLWVMEYNQDSSFRMEPSVKNISMRDCGNDKRKDFNGVDGNKVSRFILESRKKYLGQLLEEYGSGRKNRKTQFPVLLPSVPQFRKTRRIDGLATLTEGREWTTAEDSIGMFTDWSRPGFVWEMPYRTLLPRGLKNIIVAGRCISSEKYLWDITRAIPPSALSGEAAGIAAAVSASTSVSPDELPVERVQDELRLNGGKIHFHEIGLSPKDNKL